jgi:hypothetical protein
VDRWLEADAAIAAWTLTTVEISSAIQRLLRDGEIAEEVAGQAEQRASKLVESCHVIIDIGDAARGGRRSAESA